MKDRNKGEVVFRKIKGRIVPIRRKKADKPELGKAGALGAAGFGIAAAAGEAGAWAVRKAAAMRTEAKIKFGVAHRALRRAQAGQMGFDFLPGVGSRKSAQQAAVKTRIRSRMLFKSRNLILGFGALVGGSVLSQGLERIDDPDSIAEGITADVSGGGAVAGVAGAIYYRRLGVKGLGNLFKFTRARMKGMPRSQQIPIKFKSRVTGQGTLKF
jgi:hypothetical protein